MKLKVKNFGPISHADINIKPLTLIIGKNNAGKSMLAQLIFTLRRLREGRFPRRFLLRTLRRMRETGVIALPLISPLTFKFEDFKKRMKKRKEITPHSFVEIIIKTIIDNSTQPLNDTLKKLLERNFAVELGSLVNLYSDYAKVECAYSEYSIIEFMIAKDGSFNSKFNIKIEKLVDHLLKNKRIRRLVRKCIRSMDEEESPISLITKIGEFVLPEKPFLQTLYIPAGRAGLLEGFEAVSSSLIELAPIAPLRGISMPPIPGTASEFYRVMLLLEGKKGPFTKIADPFKDIMEGDITLEKLKAPKGKSKIVYKFKFKDKEGSVDLILAASMIKELAPIYLIVKELANKGHLLIIEEPESHLHPAAQIKLMEVFAKLINEGLHIVMTTHSDILLRKLAHLVMVSSTKSKTHVALRPEDVSVYLLKPDKNGYITQEVNILEEMPTFDEVIEQLYEEERSLYLSLQRES